MISDRIPPIFGFTQFVITGIILTAVILAGIHWFTKRRKSKNPEEPATKPKELIILISMSVIISFMFSGLAFMTSDMTARGHAITGSIESSRIISDGNPYKLELRIAGLKGPVFVMSDEFYSRKHGTIPPSLEGLYVKLPYCFELMGTSSGEYSRWSCNSAFTE